MLLVIMFSIGDLLIKTDFNNNAVNKQHVMLVVGSKNGHPLIAHMKIMPYVEKGVLTVE